MEDLRLDCACGEMAIFACFGGGNPNFNAYQAGWRLGKKNRQLCPKCAAKYARRLEREDERRRAALPAEMR